MFVVDWWAVCMLAFFILFFFISQYMLISIPIIKSEIAFYTTDDGDAKPVWCGGGNSSTDGNGGDGWKSLWML